MWCRNLCHRQNGHKGSYGASESQLFNTLLAHLGESTSYRHRTDQSAIFLGMELGDTAVLNRDMFEWDTVHDASRRKLALSPTAPRGMHVPAAARDAASRYAHARIRNRGQF